MTAAQTHARPPTLQTTTKRLIAAAQAAGLTVTGVEMCHNGTLRVLTAATGSAAAAEFDRSFDQWQQSREKRSRRNG